MGNQGVLFEVALESDISEPAMLKAAKAQIQDLKDQGLIKGEHVMTCQMILSLAEAIGKAAAKGQASAMSFASKELREFMALLPKPATISSMDELMAALNEAGEPKNDKLYS